MKIPCRKNGDSTYFRLETRFFKLPTSNWITKNLLVNYFFITNVLTYSTAVMRCMDTYKTDFTFMLLHLPN